MVIIPPTVIALIGATSVGIFIASSAAAVGVRVWWIDGMMGFGIALSVVFGFAFLFWLGWLYPTEKPVVVREQVMPALPTFTPENDGRTLVRNPVESIPFEKVYQVAHFALDYNAPISFRGLANVLTGTEISHLQTELKNKNMAIEKPNGGIVLTKKGVDKLSQYLSPTASPMERKNVLPA